MSTTVRTSIYIDRPPPVVAAVLLDPDKAILWTSDLERFEVLEGRPGLVGSRARLHYQEGGRRYVMEDELLEIEPDRRFLSRVSGEAIEAEVETFLEPDKGGTLLTIDWRGRGKPLLLKLLLPFMRRSVARQAQADLVKLKALVEAT